MTATYHSVIEELMNPSLAYYAGRGNMHVDLDSYKLERIWENILDQAGYEAAGAFVRMVSDLTARGDMSATTFLSALSDMAQDGWQYRGLTYSSDVATASAIEGAQPELKSMLRIVASSPLSPSTTTADAIAGDFLSHHPAAPRRCNPWEQPRLQI